MVLLFLAILVSVPFGSDHDYSPCACVRMVRADSRNDVCMCVVGTDHVRVRSASGAKL